MSKFIEYLAESVKTYDFKIKIAGDLPDGFDKAMKECLMKYDCASITKGKRTPIQESPLDFPDMKNTHVTIFDVSCRYPATPQVIAEYLADTLKINRGGIRVRSTKEEEDLVANLEAVKRIGTSTEALLNKPYEDGPKEKKLDFLKELGKISHKGEQYKGVNDQLMAKSSPEESPAEKDENIGTTSPLGNKKPTFVDPFKGRNK